MVVIEIGIGSGMVGSVRGETEIAAEGEAIQGAEVEAGSTRIARVGTIARDMPAASVPGGEMGLMMALVRSQGRRKRRRRRRLMGQTILILRLLKPTGSEHLLG